MNRRELLVLSTATLMAPPIFSARAQEGLSPDDGLRPTQRQVVGILESNSLLDEMVAAVDALRANLLLLQAPDNFSALFEAANAEKTIGDYNSIKKQARDGAAKLKGQLESNDEVMPAMDGKLERSVQLAAAQLREGGVQPGSRLYLRQVQGFWTFLFILRESEQLSTDSIMDWLCGSNPFSILCR